MTSYRTTRFRFKLFEKNEFFVKVGYSRAAYSKSKIWIAPHHSQNLSNLKFSSLKFPILKFLSLKFPSLKFYSPKFSNEI